MYISCKLGCKEHPLIVISEFSISIAKQVLPLLVFVSFYFYSRVAEAYMQAKLWSKNHVDSSAVVLLLRISARLSQ